MYLGGTIVYKDDTFTVVWNGSHTFNIFDGDTEIDVFTSMNVHTVEAAINLADEHMEYLYE